MSKFYSPEAYEEMVNGYVANGFSRGAAEEIVAAEEAIAMQEYDEWLDEVDATSFHTDDVRF
jgi:hypothetical protein